MKIFRPLVLLFMLSFLFFPVAEAQLLKKILNATTTAVKSKKKETANSNDNIALRSESEDEIVLTVSADGANKDDAIKTALRSAIEQAYGTFVSANTTILNDELVKDEIITVASGNIKEYKEIASETIGNKTFVTLQAKVCISKLVSYAQNKGAETEFAGATFAMNMRMKELNKRNEEVALKNLANQIISMYPSAFSYNLSIDEPRLWNNHRGRLYGNEGFFYLPDKPSDIGLTGNYEDYYYCSLKITIESNSLMDNIEDLIIKTFYSLALSNSEVEEYQKHDIPYYRSNILSSRHGPDYHLNKRVMDKIERLCSPGKRIEIINNSGPLFCMRSDCTPIFTDINEAIGKILHSFRIKDNIGNYSIINQWKLEFVTGSDVGIVSTSGKGLLFPYAKWSGLLLREKYGGYSSDFYIANNGINLYYTQNPLLLPFIFIKKDEIHKFSNFSIEPISSDSITFDDEKRLIDFLSNRR